MMTVQYRQMDDRVLQKEETISHEKDCAGIAVALDEGRLKGG
jgi:hypothetical protein